MCVSEPRKVLPILKTDEPICPEGKLACGSGDCIEKDLFCNGKPDCKDESDENACSKYTTTYLKSLLWSLDVIVFISINETFSCRRRSKPCSRL